ncbi:unnamed protein product, partial [Ectocarpus sp. 4 AP-2014]
ACSLEREVTICLRDSTNTKVLSTRGRGASRQIVLVVPPTPYLLHRQASLLLVMKCMEVVVGASGRQGSPRARRWTANGKCWSGDPVSELEGSVVDLCSYFEGNLLLFASCSTTQVP